MPLYYLSVSCGEEAISPDEGIELEDDQAAWEEAIEASGEMIRDMNSIDFEPSSEWRMDVKRASGDLVYRLRFQTEAFGQGA